MNEILAKYLRLSLEDGDVYYKTKYESNSIANQRSLLDGYIAAHNDLKAMTVVEFCDDGKSGTNFDRPGIQRLLDEIKNGHVKGIIVKDFSRFGRDYIMVSDYLEQIFPFLGVRFISVNDRFDSNDYPYGTAGMIDIGFKQIIHQHYSETLSQKLLDTKKRLFKSGKFHSSFPFYGYQKSKSEKYKLEVDKEAAAVVRMIFDLCIKGNTTLEIAAKLNEAGLPTPLERLREVHPTKSWNTVSEKYTWTNASVRQILSEERYTGKSIYGRTKVDKIGSRRCIPVPKKDWVIVPDMHEAIISQEIYDAAQKIRKTRIDLLKDKSKEKSNRIFISKVRCGYCGYAMKYHPGNNAYFLCERYLFGVDEECKRNRVYERDLTELILQGIRTQAKVLYQKTNEITGRRDSETSSYAEGLKSLRTKLNKIPLLKEQAFNKLLNEIISEEENAKIYHVLDENEAKYHAEMQRLNEKIQQLSMNSDQYDANLNQAESLINIQVLTRELVDTLIRAISIFKDNHIEISWNFFQTYDIIENKI